MFMQFYVFINTTKGIDFKWEFVSLFKYSKKYFTWNILYIFIYLNFSQTPLV